MPILSRKTINLLILGESGDVLEALTRVPELAEKYVGKVKLIYIDPPFNTAQTFASYEDNLEHSVWLTMMRDRLLHMKKLLSSGGSIWVHLDYAENHKMRVSLDEVFGGENFVAEIVWQKADSGRNDATYFSTDQDVLLVYRKSALFELNRLPRPDAMNSRFANPDHDPRGPWAMADPCAPDVPNNQPMVYAIQHPMTGELMYPAQSSCWRLAPSVMFEEMSKWARYELRDTGDRVKRAEVSGVPVEAAHDMVPAIMLAEPLDSAREHSRAVLEPGLPLLELVFTRGGLGRIMRKSRIPSRGMVPRTLWPNSDVSHSRGAKKELVNLFPGVTAFATPKPERLLQRVLLISTGAGDLVLDAFAGSGTTAAVAQKMGRRWVTCELVEDTFERFTKARLAKVVNDADPGGVTRTKGERIAAEDVELPEGVSPEDAAKFTSVLNKLIADEPEAKKDPRVKALKAAAKTTRTKEVMNWRGGGGFHVAHLSPACFDYDPALDRVVSTPEATGQVLIESVAANLGFPLLHPDDDYIFEGRRGNTLLKVIEGVTTVELVDDLVKELAPGETLVLAATSVLDGVREYLRKVRKGSRVVAVPDDVFGYQKETAL